MQTLEEFDPDVKQEYLNFGYDNSNVVGILVNTAEKMGNLFIHSAIKGVTNPVRNLNAFVEVISMEHASIKDSFSAVVQLFIEKAKEGAGSYVTFIGDILSILYSMVQNMLLLNSITAGLIN